MNPKAYQAFTDTLVANLKADERVLGVVALGSMADESRRDAYSDHDFFVIVNSGSQELFRQNVSWLPDASNIVLNLRETEHGLKILYQSGHLLEFAVFDLSELALAKVNDYAILYDTGDILTEIQKVVHSPHQKPTDLLFHLQMVLCLTHVGVGRAKRGEVLSGHVFIKSYALSHLLNLLQTLLGDQSGLDNLDVFRRFESKYPSYGERLNTLLLLPPIDCAETMLDFLDDIVGKQLDNYPQKAVDVIREHLRL